MLFQETGARPVDENGVYRRDDQLEHVLGRTQRQRGLQVDGAPPDDE